MSSIAASKFDLTTFPLDPTIDALHHLRSLELCNNAKRSDLRALDGLSSLLSSCTRLEHLGLLVHSDGPTLQRFQHYKWHRLRSLELSFFCGEGGRTAGSYQPALG